MNDKVIEFRGVDMLCIAEVKCDDNSTEAEHGYVTGDWESARRWRRAPSQSIMTISLCLSSALRGLIRSL